MMTILPSWLVTCIFYLGFILAVDHVGSALFRSIAFQIWAMRGLWRYNDKNLLWLMVCVLMYPLMLGLALIGGLTPKDPMDLPFGTWTSPTNHLYWFASSQSPLEAEAEVEEKPSIDTGWMG